MPVFFLLFFFTAIFASCQSQPATTDSYRIAYDPSWYPLNIMGKQDELDGFTKDLLKTIAASENLNIEQITLGGNLLYRLLEDGKIDAVLSGLELNDITIAKYSFSEPFLMIGPVLVVRQDSQIDKLADMQEKIIGVIGSTHDDLIAQKIPNIIIKRYERPAMALEDLAAGNLDGLLLAVLEAQSFITDLYANQLKIVTPVLTDQALRLATKKNQLPALITSFNAGLHKMLEKHIYEQLLLKWDLVK